jgi:penicillin amidase
MNEIEDSMRKRSTRATIGRVLLGILIAMILLVGLVGAGAVVFVGRTLPTTTGSISVKGLERPTYVLRDGWGVPHITAANLHDVLFAQGYVAAQDRLFQMDFNRWVAEGRLAEAFGAGDNNSLIDADEFLRTLNLYASAQSEVKLLDSRTYTELQAYSDGVNAFIDSHQNSLPLEFSVLGITPQPWTPVDSLAYGRVVALSLDNTWYAKYTRAMIATKAGSAVAGDLFPAYPSTNPTLLAANGSAAPLVNTPPGVTKLPAPAVATADQSVTPPLLSASLLRGVEMVHSLLGSISDSLGSNNWVVDGTKTVTGAPLLANDPHLGISMPSIWYEVALRGGGLDVIGFTFPGVPGVIIGHNNIIAWGVTNVGADDTDLYLEKLDPVNHPGMYEYNGQWVPLSSRQEVIRVRGGAPVTITVNDTQDGPLLNSVQKDLKHYTAVALKWTALQPGYSFAGFFQLNFALNWQEFQAAIANISISQNFIYADTAGNIGYLMSGLLPIRPSDNDILPVDGSNSLHEWQGHVPASQMPQLFDPPTHVIVTANNQIVPPNYPSYVTTNWDQGYRARRILDLLMAKPKLSIADYEWIQADVLSIPATIIVPFLIAAGNASTGDAAAAASLLKGWDGTMSRQSVAASVYEVASGYLLRELLEPLLGKNLYAMYCANYSSSGLFSLLIGLLTAPTPPFVASSGARDRLIVQALGDTMKALRSDLGSNTAEWQWGTLHQASFQHPLATVTPLNLVFGTTPVERPGDDVTVSIGGDGDFALDPPSYAQQTVSSMRDIIDLGHFDNSLWVTTTGESGQPFSAHYSDLIPLWDQNHYQRMAYTAAAEAKMAADVLALTP